MLHKRLDWWRYTVHVCNWRFIVSLCSRWQKLMLQVNEKTSIVTSSSADTQFYSSWTLAGVCKFRTIDYRLGKAVFTAHAQLGEMLPQIVPGIMRDRGPSAGLLNLKWGGQNGWPSEDSMSEALCSWKSVGERQSRTRAGFLFSSSVPRRLPWPKQRTVFSFTIHCKPLSHSTPQFCRCNPQNGYKPKPMQELDSSKQALGWEWSYLFTMGQEFKETKTPS